jgi:hypothetical protein
MRDPSSAEASRATSVAGGQIKTSAVSVRAEALRHGLGFGERAAEPVHLPIAGHERPDRAIRHDVLAQPDRSRHAYRAALGVSTPSIENAPRSLKRLRPKEICDLTERKVDALAHTAYMDNHPT